MEKENKALKIILIALLVVLIILGVAFVKEDRKRVEQQFSGWHLVR